MNIEIQNKLIEAGAKVWEKGSLKRIYINDEVAEIVLKPIFNGYPLPKIGKSKLFYDFKYGKLFSDSGYIRTAFNATTHETTLTCGKA